ncbi:S28 family serine protease [Actinomadura sp. DC4]|uniref:S28 family serine protease n=1 Tax=Actinomadura sp. DC4 TaxID=3055069 RepID=UPI0025B09AEE|nr:S28 family serine protease [Actinomadura sp. DC4]MDN3357466.1 S28 family serine protease [Actinomadura sp. DC4]
MRKVSRGVLAVMLAAGLSGVSGTAHAATATTDGDILAQLKAIPGMTVQEKTSALTGYRWFWLNYRQPVDHRHPEKGWFEQRILLEHKSDDRPMVLYTSGYNTPGTMFLSEPTGLVDGNQISVEYRYFSPSIPQPAVWTKDNIWQAATDEHDLIKALKRIYHGKWISTGASKGGMTATYHKRYYPNDVDGTVAYVAPNDVNNKEDSAYDKFFKTVGTDPKCRVDLENLQREMLKRRPEMEARMTAAAQEAGYTWNIIKSVDVAFENSVMDFEWAFWQYHLQSECPDVPATTASTDDIYNYFDLISGALTYTDQGLEQFIPYYYQAGTQLGWPSPSFKYLHPLLRHESTYQPRTYVPRDIPMKFDPTVMPDIDRWVKTSASHMLFLYGQNDPWGAEPFRVGPHARDSKVFVSPGLNHSGRLIATLPAAQKAEATADVLRWAGVSAPQNKTLLGPQVTEDPALAQHPRL